MSRKARADSKLKSLPDAVQGKIYVLLQQTTLAKAVPLIAKEHGVQTSPAALSQFFSWYPLSRRLEQAANFADSLAKQLAATPNLNIDAEKLSTVAQVAFEARAVQEQDAELYFNMKKLRLKERDQALVERRIKLLEKKAELADKAKEIAGNKDLSEEQQAQQVRALFGMG